MILLSFDIEEFDMPFEYQRDISFEDQIIANLESRLNNEIEKIQDEDIRGDILEEMTIPVIHYNRRMKFLGFFRSCISRIREEMYQEFRSYMEDNDYDFYFRKAIIHYEGCENKNDIS